MGSRSALSCEVSVTFSLVLLCSSSFPHSISLPSSSGLSLTRHFHLFTGCPNLFLIALHGHADFFQISVRPLIPLTCFPWPAVSVRFYRHLRIYAQPASHVGHHLNYKRYARANVSLSAGRGVDATNS